MGCGKSYNEQFIWFVQMADSFKTEVNRSIYEWAIESLFHAIRSKLIHSEMNQWFTIILLQWVKTDSIVFNIWLVY